MAETMDRALRTTQVYCFIVGLALLIPYGINSKTVTLPLGLIPACFSAVVGLVGLANGLKKRAVAIPFDSILLAFHIGIFVPGLVYLSRGRATWASDTVLGTYATMPLLIDILIHAYCILRHLPLPGFGTTTCPNCQHEHSVKPHIHFPSTMWAPSTIFTPEDNESEAPLTHDYDDMTIGRASSDLDGATVIGGEPRLNHPLTSETKNNGRLV